MFISNVILAVLLKVILVLLISRFLLKLTESRLEAVVGGWVISYIVMIFFMAILSIGSHMTKSNMIIAYVASIVGLGIIYIKKQDKSKENENSIRTKISLFFKQFHSVLFIFNCVAIIGIVVIIVFLIVHNLYYFDCMTDEYCYGMPRIELYVQKHSIFVNMQTVALNIFCNEWNGELSGTYYMMMAGTVRGVMLGNAENFAVGGLIFILVARMLGAPKNTEAIIALPIYATPIIVALAMLIKGDFLGTIMLPLGFAYSYAFLKANEKRKLEYYAVMACFALAIAAGSKLMISTATGMVAITLLAVLILKKKQMLDWKVIVVIVMGSILGCLRYVMNFIVYGSFFKRVGCESIDWLERIKDLPKLILNMREFITDMWKFDDMHTFTGGVAAVVLDYGVWGRIFLILLIVSIICYIYQWKKRDRKRTIIIITSIITLIVAYIGIGRAELGALRYFAPWINLFMFFVLIHIIQCTSKKKWMVFICTGAVLAVGVYGIVNTENILSRDGELKIGTHEEAANRTTLELQYETHPYVLETADYPTMGDTDVNDFMPYISSGKKVLICNYVASIVSYLYGEDNGNDVYYCTPSELEEEIATGDYDVIAISSEFMGEETNLIYDTVTYPDAVYTYDPSELDAELQQEYTVFKPLPEACRMYVYVKSSLID